MDHAKKRVFIFEACQFILNREQRFGHVAQEVSVIVHVQLVIYVNGGQTKLDKELKFKKLTSMARNSIVLYPGWQ